MVSPKKVDQLVLLREVWRFHIIDRRFIPFGVRNGLFLTAGLTKMNFIKFALADLAACTISCTLFFNLYYKFGESVIEYVKKGNIVLFSFFLIGILTYFLKKKKHRSISQQ